LQSAEKTEGRAQRSFVFTYEVHVPAAPAGSEQSRLWIPLPQSDEHQSINKLVIESSIPHKTGKESEYGNSFAVFTPRPAEAAAGYDVTLRFEVTRREYLRDLRATDGQPPLAKDAMLKRYLQPDKMVPLNATIAELARAQTEGITAPLEKAHKIYNYVASTMRYDKSGEGWGRGDEMWACDSKRGNCTDFHSVLIGMMRSSGRVSLLGRILSGWNRLGAGGCIGSVQESRQARLFLWSRGCGQGEVHVWPGHPAVGGAKRGPAEFFRLSLRRNRWQATERPENALRVQGPGAAGCNQFWKLTGTGAAGRRSNRPGVIHSRQRMG
jgi:hypothetical protein